MTTERDNSGTLSRNAKKTQERHPDVRGQCVIGGRAYWVAGWQRKNEYGTFYSLAFTPKEQPATGATSAAMIEKTPDGKVAYTAEPPKPGKSTRELLDDDIPF